MTEPLVRFGVAMEASLLAQLDDVAATRGCTRSELLRDLARAELVRSAPPKRVPAVAAVTLVYNHHVRELSDRLTSIQHELGDSVRAAMHVHLDHDNCLEVVVMRGPSDRLKSAAERMVSTRGVTHGSLELVPDSVIAMSRSHRHGAGHDAHPHHHHGTERPAPRAKRVKKTSRAARPGR